MFFSPSSAAQFLPKAYNAIAENFSETRNHSWAEFSELFENMNTEGNFLDLGCGNGRLLAFLQAKKFEGTYTGCDISKDLMQKAREKWENKKNVFFEEGSFLTNLPENFYTSIAAIASFHHLPTVDDRKKALENIFLGLKDGGKFFCTVWNLNEQEKYCMQKKEAQNRAFWNPFFSENDFIVPFGNEKIPRYYHAFSEEELRFLLLEAGFSDVKIFPSEGRKNWCAVATKQKNASKKFFLHGIPFEKTTFENVLENLWNWGGEKGLQKKVYTPNPEMLVECSKNPEFFEILHNADLSFADGNGILWASGLDFLHKKAKHWRWILGIFSLFHYSFSRKTYPKKVQKTICGSDVFREFLKKSEQEGRKNIFLLGGFPGSAIFLKENFSCISNFFDGIVNEKTLPEIVEKVNASNATVLFVALGAPKQETIIAQHLSKMPKISFAMGVGGSFDFLSGHQKRAPKIFQRTGLEWLFRLCTDPKRANRIWNATGKFVALCLGRKGK